MVKDYGKKNLIRSDIHQSGQVLKPKKDDKKKNRRELLKKGILFILLLVFIFCIYMAILIRGGPEIILTRYGRIADEFSGKGLLVRSEEVIYAPYPGRVTLFVKEGERCPAERPILRLEGSGGVKTFYSRKAGVISYQVDGLENTLNPDILDDIVEQDYKYFRGKLIKITDGDRVNAGRPLFKIVDNFILYLLVEAPASQVFRYEVGEKIWATFDGLTIVGWITKILDHQNLFIIKLERFPIEMINKRWVDVTIMTNAYTGVYVPRKAITKKGDEFGVYRVVDDTPVFYPISQKGGNELYVVVTGIGRGVEILANPEKDLVKYSK
ncbi:hypothetical protein BBF96_06195 [Anoxybacter fermentans]|uniref:RND related barrel-sandwich hybrid domain-containing protein n=1 Tax=Anoxybacter fermentans TaxID=1323375 RepID=A0A3Q9HQ37_9FIRM|nr:HlyD family efflux transporter periplasmic adaptor subunit [Anoxybacter fermentans]AZR73023.1 hypothetical protein BBF96_06195 [Anoxybacter fermentans]